VHILWTRDHGQWCADPEIFSPRKPWIQSKDPHDPVARLKLSMGPIRGPYSVYPRHVRALMLPKSTHTMHFKWHHRNLSKNDHESLERKRIMNEDTHLLLMWKEKSLYRWFICYILPGPCRPLEHRVAIWFGLFRFFEHEQSNYFAGALTIFAGALPPWAPPWWRGWIHIRSSTAISDPQSVHVRRVWYTWL